MKDFSRVVSVACEQGSHMAGWLGWAGLGRAGLGWGWACSQAVVRNTAIAGAIDGTNIPIKAHVEDPNESISGKFFPKSVHFR